jgi:hypothetical protein
VVGLVIVLGANAQGLFDLINFIASVAAVTAILIYICLKKGESPR